MLLTFPFYKLNVDCKLSNRYFFCRICARKGLSKHVAIITNKAKPLQLKLREDVNYFIELKYNSNDNEIERRHLNYLPLYIHRETDGSKHQRGSTESTQTKKTYMRITIQSSTINR